jgi:hypothetical protein
MDKPEIKTPPKSENKVRLVARHRVEHGQLVNGRNLVKIFNEGDIVAGIDPDAINSLINIGAVERDDVNNSSDQAT